MIICVGELKAGMKLASDVKGANGRLLLPAGTLLEEQHLRIFNIWGVNEADIKEASLKKDDSSEPQETDQCAEAAQLHAETLFAHANLDEAPMVFFKEACVKEYEKRLIDNQALPTPPTTLNDEHKVPSSPVYSSITDFLSSDTQLGAFPDVYYKIMDALDDPLSTATTLADIISKEPSICSRLLTLVNSPLYGYSQPVDSLNRAVSMVGTKGLSQLALGVTVMNKFHGLSDKHFTMNDFWRHSLACGAFNRILASQVPGTSQDMCFVAGMLHDLGKLIMLQLAPDESVLACQLSNTQRIPIHEAEELVFGFNHCELAEELFQTWNFPQELTAAAVLHHGRNDDAPPVEAAICAVGNMLAVAQQHGSNGSRFVHAPYPGAWGALGLTESALVTTMLTGRRQIGDILTVFLG